MRAKRGKKRTLVGRSKDEQIALGSDKDECSDSPCTNPDVIYVAGVGGIDWRLYRVFRVTKTGISIVAKDIGNK